MDNNRITSEQADTDLTNQHRLQERKFREHIATGTLPETGRIKTLTQTTKNTRCHHTAGATDFLTAQSLQRLARHPSGSIIVGILAHALGRHWDACVRRSAFPDFSSDRIAP